MGSIGIFDSGIGGISILKEIVKIINDQKIYYIADQKNLPYGEKSTNFLKKRVKKISDLLISKGCSTIVIACNTATVATIQWMRKNYPNTNFVGVEPAIKPASLHADEDGEVLVLATNNTLQSKRLKELEKKFSKGTKFSYQPLPEFVKWAEGSDFGSMTKSEKVTKRLKEISNKNVKSVVLACTHYPLFYKEIKKRFIDAKIFDPSKAVAIQTKKTHKQTINNNQEVFLLTTKEGGSFEKTVKNLLKFPIKIKLISL
ncbi:glutamate racemase [Patescibacteria group bacterium]